MIVLYPNLCYNEVCYKGTALYIRALAIFKCNSIFKAFIAVHNFSCQLYSLLLFIGSLHSKECGPDQNHTVSVHVKFTLF